MPKLLTFLTSTPGYLVALLVLLILTHGIVSFIFAAAIYVLLIETLKKNA